jgi:hypothetical protein
VTTSRLGIRTLCRMTSRPYRVVFRGESDVLAAAFPGLTSEFEGGNTVLSGRILDRSQLQGILAQADSLGFELVSVNPIEAVGDASHDRASRVDD